MPACQTPLPTPQFLLGAGNPNASHKSESLKSPWLLSLMGAVVIAPDQDVQSCHSTIHPSFVELWDPGSLRLSESMLPATELWTVPLAFHLMVFITAITVRHKPILFQICKWKTRFRVHKKSDTLQDLNSQAL